VKVSVDSGVCEDDEGYSAVGTDRPVPDGEEDVAKAGVDSCPVRALSLHE
jgi:ferredoxin